MNTKFYTFKYVFLLLIAVHVNGQTETDKTQVSETENKMILETSDHQNDDSTAIAEKPDTQKTKKGKPMFGPGIKPANEKNMEPGMGISMVQYVLSIGFVIILMIGILWLLNRINSGYSSNNRKSYIKVTNRVHLDNKNSLALVEFQNDQLLIGVGANGVTLLNKSNKNSESTVVGGINNVDS